MSAAPNDVLARIQPIVLVGGKSRRFGRDKLVEPWGEAGRVLVDYPIAALRGVFGPRVVVVGQCNPAVVARADGTIEDAHPGIGPIGGIVSALVAWEGPVFVLAGDMPAFGARDVERIVRRWYPGHLGVHAVLAETADGLHPCAGLYAYEARIALQARIAAGEHRLTTALPHDAVIRVACEPASVANVNSLENASPGDDASPGADPSTSAGASTPSRRQARASSHRPDPGLR
ncbi:MAG: molybdenum cofactor guanylyltransferase [Phycisphaerae bacterium]|nr:molybdenum cofactor guanylyltransferase [Phycisphaerae bacterium]